MIELQNITKTYQTAEKGKKRDVLNGISLNIEKGNAIAIVGPSGSGKSTLLNIAGTLDTPSGGKVIIDGEETSQLKDKELASIRNRKTGFVFQMHHLLPQLTLLENILVPAIPLGKPQKETTKRAYELLESVGLADHAMKHPGQLSGGECQRAAVIRALINQPDYLLADEPTGSLDEEAAENLGNLLVEMNKKHNVATVLVTHAMSLANKMQTKYRLTKGILDKIQ